MEWCSCICLVFSISTPHSCVDFFSMFSCCWICFKHCKWNQQNKQNVRIEQDQVIFCLHLVYCVICHSSTWVHCYPLRPLHRNYFRVTLFSTEKENNSQTTNCLINSVHSIFWDDQCSGRKDIDEPVQGASPSWDTAARFGRDSEGCARIEAGKEIFKIIIIWKSTWKICDILMSIHPSNSFGRIAGREEWKVRRNNIRFELFGSDLAEKSLFSRCPPSLFPPK